MAAGEHEEWIDEAATLRALRPRYLLFLCVQNFGPRVPSEPLRGEAKIRRAARWPRASPGTCAPKVV